VVSGLKKYEQSRQYIAPEAPVAQPAFAQYDEALRQNKEDINRIAGRVDDFAASIAGMADALNNIGEIVASLKRGAVVDPSDTPAGAEAQDDTAIKPLKTATKKKGAAK